jgi:4-hydroxybenzoate polyprenyltransferase
MARFLPFARLLRLPNVFTAMADIFMAALAANALAAEPVSPLRFLCLLIASCSLYCSGMIWNDYFDLEQDRKERAFRPLAAGVISIAAASRLAFLLMGSGLVFAVLADLGPGGFRYHSTLIALLLMAAIFLYDGALKRTWAGPVVMGSCRFLNVLLGLSVTATAPFMWGWALALVVALYVVGLTWFARTEARTSNPTLLILGASVMLAALVLALTLPTLVQDHFPAHRPPFIFPYLLVGFALYLCLAIIPAIQRPIPRLVQPAVKRSILGLILLDAILATAVAGYIGLGILLLYLPSYFLGRWVYST